MAAADLAAELALSEAEERVLRGLLLRQCSLRGALHSGAGSDGLPASGAGTGTGTVKGTGAGLTPYAAGRSPAGGSARSGNASGHRAPVRSSSRRVVPLADSKRGAGVDAGVLTLGSPSRAGSGEGEWHTDTAHGSRKGVRARVAKGTGTGTGADAETDAGAGGHDGSTGRGRGTGTGRGRGTGTSTDTDASSGGRGGGGGSSWLPPPRSMPSFTMSNHHDLPAGDSDRSAAPTSPVAGAGGVKRRRSSVSVAAAQVTQVGSPIAVATVLVALAMYFAYPILWLELSTDVQVETAVPTALAVVYMAVVIGTQLAWDACNCSCRRARRVVCPCVSCDSRAAGPATPAHSVQQSMRRRRRRASHTGSADSPMHSQCHLAAEDRDSKTLRGRVNMKMNNDIYEAMQLGVTCLGLTNWVLYSNNVEVLTNGTQTTYELTGMSESGKKAFFEREVFVVCSMALDVLLRVITARNRWKTLLSFYILSEVGIFFFVAYYQPLAVSTGLTKLTVYSLYLCGGPLRILRMRRAVKALDSRRSPISSSLTFGPFTMNPAKAEVVVVGTRVVLYVLACAATLMTLEFACVPEFTKAVSFAEAQDICEPAVQSFHQAIYFLVVTLSTVGYGDVLPVTNKGQWATVFIIIVGLIQVPIQVNEMKAVMQGDELTDTQLVLVEVERLTREVSELRSELSQLSQFHTGRSGRLDASLDAKALGSRPSLSLLQDAQRTHGSARTFVETPR